MNFELWLNAFLAFFAILNPIGNVPIFSEMTDELDKQTRFHVFNVAILTGFFTLLTMSLSGKWIMEKVFQIDISEFRIAGGILLLIIAIRYIVFPPKEHELDFSTGDKRSRAMEAAVIPMAVPLLVGPGSIVTGIIILDRDGVFITISTMIAVFALSWVLFQLSHHISLMLGKIGRMVIGRILWIFIAAIGVHFLISGLQLIFGV